VWWAFGALTGLANVTVALLSILRANRLDPQMKELRPLFIALAVAYSILVPAGLYGAIRMYRGTSHGWAVASAVLLCVSCTGCPWNWVAAIVALLVLYRPDVLTLFDLDRDDAPLDSVIELRPPPLDLPEPDPVPEEPEWLDEDEPASRKPDKPSDTNPPASPPAPSNP